MFRLWPWPAPWLGTGSLKRAAPSDRIHAQVTSRSRAQTWGPSPRRGRIRSCAGCWPGGQDQGTYRDAEAGDVGDQIGGIGEESQRPEHDPAGDLDEQQGGVDAQCPAQCAALPGARDVSAVLERMPGT